MCDIKHYSTETQNDNMTRHGQTESLIYERTSARYKEISPSRYIHRQIDRQVDIDTDIDRDIDIDIDIDI